MKKGRGDDKGSQKSSPLEGYIEAYQKRFDNHQQNPGSASDISEEEQREISQIVEQQDLFPKPKDGIVFNGRNLEEFSHVIFPHSRAQGVKDDVRNIEVEGGTIRIKSIPSTGNYTHKVQETLMACLRHWQVNANFSGEIEVTLSALCRLKNLRPTGENIVLTKRHLNILYDTVQDWIIGGFDKKGDPRALKKFRYFLHFDYQDGTHRGDASNFDKVVRIKFDERLTQNMLTGKVNPVAMNTILSIKNEMSASWFQYTDTRITQNNFGRISGRSMVKKLMLSPKRYERPANRYILLDTIKKHCDGKELSNGKTYRCRITKTKDGKDYLLVESVGDEILKFEAPKRRLQAINTDADQINYLALEIFQVVGEDQNMQWYRYIAKYCHTNTIFRALGEYKESSQATKVISPSAYFTSILHVHLHSMGKEWIAKDCGANCPHRPGLIH